MYLTKLQESMLKGEFGPAVQKAMEILVSLGDALGAEKLIPITSAHVSGVSYASIGDAGLSFIEDFASLGAKSRVITTINPAGADLMKWRRMGISEEFYEKQLRIINAFRKMGFQITCTCTPYLIDNCPNSGDHIAWAESSAIVYVNSVIGAKTNRESGPSAIASAITGYTPYCGYHLESNRVPSHRVKVNLKINTLLKASALGYLIGQELITGIPLLENLELQQDAKKDLLKAISAGLATSGGISLFYLEGKRIFPSRLEEYCVDRKDLLNIIEHFQECKIPEYIFIGCPHCSLSEIRELALMLGAQKIKKNVDFWIFTSREIFEKARAYGYVKVIEHAGIKVFCDTCPVVMPNEIIYNAEIITNSCKAAHYLTSLKKAKVTLMDLRSIIKLFTR